MSVNYILTNTRKVRPSNGRSGQPQGVPPNDMSDGTRDVKHLGWESRLKLNVYSIAYRIDMT